MHSELPRNFKIVTVWLLAGLMLFLAVQWWMHRQAQTRFAVRGGTIEIARSGDGHYHWPGQINGRPVDFLIDTGATGTAMSGALADDLGLATIRQVRSSTAGGPVTGRLVRADLVLKGGVTVERLQVVALPALGPQPLLGMDVLGKLRWQQRDGVLRIDLQPAL